MRLPLIMALLSTACLAACGSDYPRPVLTPDPAKLAQCQRGVSGVPPNCPRSRRSSCPMAGSSSCSIRFARATRSPPATS